jgi:DNA-binding NtrC family response regulator
VRELRNAVARRVALGELAAEPREARRSTPPSDAALPAGCGPQAGDTIERVLARNLPLAVAREEVIVELERRYVERVLAAHEGNVTRAAQASGIARRYFHTLKARLGV